jgi:RNA recognition motif-containing protein
MNINILNLSRKTTKEDLVKLFKVHGKVESCDIVMDKITGKSKGFAFIEMLDDNEAKASIKILNGKNVGGNKIKVKVSTKAK